MNMKGLLWRFYVLDSAYALFCHITFLQPKQKQIFLDTILFDAFKTAIESHALFVIFYSFFIRTLPQTQNLIYPVHGKNVLFPRARIVHQKFPH